MFLSLALNITGSSDRHANRQSNNNEFSEKKSLVDVNLFRVLPNDEERLISRFPFESFKRLG